MLIGWLSIEANYIRRTKEILGVTDEVKNLNKRNSYFADRQQKVKADTSYENKTSAQTRNCFKCQGDHYLDQCSHFKALSIEERQSEVRRLNLCWNCL